MVPNNCLTAIIVDDESHAVANLKKLLGIYCPFINVIEATSGVGSAAIQINRLKPDVIFLDVSMPKRNGFELLDMLDYLPMVVFVTAHEKYALNAFRASAVDFLLKPIDVTELIRVEQKLIQIQAIRKNNPDNGYSAILVNLLSVMNNQGVIRKITLPDTEGYNIVDLADVLYLEGDDNYTYFYLNEQRKVVVSKTLKDYEDLLTEAGFFRIHKSSIINLRHLRNIKKENGTGVVMSDGRTLTVSRRRSSELLDKARNYLG